MKTDGLYAVIRFSNGNLNGTASVKLFSADNTDGIRKCVTDLYREFSSTYIETKEVPHEMTVYLDTCLRNDLEFSYVFNGNVYGHEEIFVTRKCGIDYGTENEESMRNERT